MKDFNLMEKWIFNLSVPILFITVILTMFTQQDFTGFATSDGSYKSPVSDGSYQSPKSDESYESPTTGEGYVPPKIDETWTAPTEGPGFEMPEIGKGFVKPEIGPGFENPKMGEGYERIGTYNISFNESGEKIIQMILELPKTDFTNLTDDKKGNITGVIKNDPKKPDVKPTGPIDEESVGGWKVYGITHYYKNGGSKFIPATIAHMNLHDDGTYDYAGHEGSWESADISEEDWQKWGIKNEKFKKKIIFHNWPEGVDGNAEGPIEDTSYGARFLWAVFNAEPPESEQPAQAWLRFVAAPYVPKEQKKEDESFSELSLIGKWGIYFIPVRQNEKGQWIRKFETTTILELKIDKTWTYGTSSGTWKTASIEAEDWIKWGVNPYGPKKKIVLENFGDNGGFGPIEVYKGQVSFFWLRYSATNPENGHKVTFQKKFRPWESETAYLTGEIKGSGKISAEDGKINCGEQCTGEYDVNSNTTLTAVPENGWLFLKWSGACEGSEEKCRLTMDKSKTVKAEFSQGCKDNSECSSDQTCENSRCSPVECECGYAQNNQCQKYECCQKSDCGNGKICDTTTHQCISESTCREFSINGDSAEKHDVVFVGDGFDDYKVFRQLLVFLVDYDGKYNGFFSVTPFKENKDKFNFWMVLAPDYQYYDDGEPVNEDIERFVKTCERDTVVVISRNTYRAYAFFPTSGNKGGRAYVSLGFAGIRGSDFASEFSGRLLLHEFGHAFGALTDEYIEYGKGSRKDLYLSPNCAETLEDAQEKWGELVGIEGVDYYTGIPDVQGTKYFKNPYMSVPEIGLFPDGSDMGDGGCSYTLSNIRPTTSSLMKNQFEAGYDYGPVNERELTNRLADYSLENDEQNKNADTNQVSSQGGKSRRFAGDAG